MKEKISVKDFCEGYDKINSKETKKRYIKDTIEITPYLSFATKETLATNLVNTTMFEYENYTDENNEIKRKKTNKVKVQSSLQYLFFCRIIIESYTNLIIDTQGFLDEYDMLNQRGLIDEITSRIPEREINELKMICDMKKDDVIFNYGTPHAFISQQIENLGNVLSVVLTPIITETVKEINNLNEEDVKELVNIFTNSFSVKK